MALRSIDQRFFTDPYVESLNKTEKLLYIYLFSSVHTNIIGVIEATPRLMAYETDSTEAEIRAALDRFERDGKVVSDGGVVWLASHIRHQCTSSPKMLVAMRAHLARVESGVIRRAICDRYPHILEGVRRPLPASVQYRIDTVSVPSRSDWIGLKTDRADAAPVEGAPAGNAYSTPLTVSPEVEAQLRRQFPGVDYDATIARIREYLERTGKPVRNALRYLTACFGNAAGPAASASAAIPPISRPSSAPEPRRAPEKAVPFSFDPKKPLPVPGATPEAFRLATPGELRVSFAQGIEKIHLLREAIRPRDAAKECTA